MRYAIKVTPKLEVSVVECEAPEGRDTWEELKIMQEHIGGYIEIVRPRPMSEPMVIVVDEEGLLKAKEYNALASFLYEDPIVGTVLIMQEEYGDDGPELRGFEKDEAEKVEIMASQIIRRML